MTMQTIFSVYDSASQLYGRPFTAVSVGSALRAFSDEVNRPDSEFGRHPSDYTLHMLGHFDESTGRISPHASPELVARGKDVRLTQE